MDDSKKAKFFCENCGSEVAAKARFCPKCGKFFSSVRCPNCGKMGTVEDFKRGCPSCHYAMSHSDIYGEEEGFESLTGTRQKRSLKASGRECFGPDFRKARTSTDEAPLWVYVASLVVLLGILAVFFIHFQ